MSTTDAAVPTRRRRPTWLVVAVAGIVGLFYAYLVWSGVELLVRQATGPLGLNGLGWTVHLLAVIVPVAIFGVAFALGHRRAAGEFALILVAGLGLAAAFWINILSYAITSFSLYGG